MSSEWKEKVESSFGAHAHEYKRYNGVQERAAKKLSEFLPDLSRPKILEIGCGVGTFTQYLLPAYPDGQFVISDVSQTMIVQAQKNIPNADDVSWLQMDGEHPNIDQRFDLIVSSMSVQWFFDLDSSLERLKKLLKPEGEILYSMPGPETFYEWRSTLDTLNLRSGTLDFDVRPDVFEEDKFSISYEDALDFLYHVKRIGAHTPRAGYMPMAYKDFKKACTFFDEKYDGHVTWHILYGQIEA